MKDYLNDHEKELIEAFYKNGTMREAVKKVLLAGIYYNGVLKVGEQGDPGKNFALALAFQKGVTNEQLGADVRAAAEGIRVVESAFVELSKYDKLVEVKSVDNPAI